MARNGDIVLPEGFAAWDGPMFKSRSYPPRVSDWTQVEVMLRSGDIYTGMALAFSWFHYPTNERVHIIGYKILTDR